MGGLPRVAGHCQRHRELPASQQTGAVGANTRASITRSSHTNVRGRTKETCRDGKYWRASQMHPLEGSSEDDRVVVVVVGQLIQNLVWIFPNGSTANTKPCSKWWINGPSKTIWMDLNGSTACYQHCSNGITIRTKPMGIFESGNFEWFQMVYH